MRIAVDAMGGDHAPFEIVKGAIDALNMRDDLHIVLVGRQNDINNCLPQNIDDNRISIVNSEEIIGMDEHPASAYRKKKDASITIATKLVKEGKADAVISAGSTGAQMVAALFGLGRIKGIDRPGLATVMPTLKGPKVLLDAGANADCKPENLLQFALMGKIYAEKILSINNPKVSLVSIGEEEAKGNELTIKAHELIKEVSDINFIGNIEGRDILNGKADVMVCDGFVGNTILKVTEGTAQAIFSLLKDEINKSTINKLGAFVLKPAFKGLKSRLDYSEYGGAPLLGLKGISIVCHGSSKALAIKNAVKAAIMGVESGFVDEIKKTL